MPIKLPDNLPAVDVLTSENIFVMTDKRAMTQDIRPLQILILNLMPTKVETETQLTRLLGNSPLQVELELLQTSSYKSQNTSEDHMIAFYKTFDEVREKYYDGMIITGAPVELMEFEEVDYWDELCQIMEWSKSHVHSTFHICWGAQAGLYYHYGIEKKKLSEKLSGVYLHRLTQANETLFRGFDDCFYVPHSRNTTVDVDDVKREGELEILALSEQAGLLAVKSKDNRQIFIMGHSEYDGNTLEKEYLRDVEAGLNPKVPENYFPDDDPSKEPMVRWRSCGNLLYTNWLNYFVYQSTPYEIEKIQVKSTPLVATEQNLTVCKFGGTSLSDADQMGKVKAILQQEPHRKVVVVSAPGKINGQEKITDLLISLCSEENLDASNKWSLLKARFFGIVDGLDLPRDFIEEELNNIAKVWRDEHNADYLISRGEYLNSLIVSRFLGGVTVDSQDLLFINDDGSIDMEESAKAVALKCKPLISEGKVVVIPGFYGSNKTTGNIKTLSRGGSDLTGSVVAYGLDADLYENWSDVSGLLLADPTVVTRAETVPVITYQELRQLAFMGAKVIHQEAMLPLWNKSIPMEIKNTNCPDGDSTLVVKDASYYQGGSSVVGISGQIGFQVITMEKTGISQDFRHRTEIMEAFENSGYEVVSVTTSIDSFTVIAKDKEQSNQAAMAKLRSQLRNHLGLRKVHLRSDMALIAVVGRQLEGDSGILTRVFNSLGSAKIPIELVDQSSGRNTVLVGVKQKDYEKAIRTIYQVCKC